MGDGELQAAKQTDLTTGRKSTSAWKMNEPSFGLGLSRLDSLEPTLPTARQNVYAKQNFEMREAARQHQNGENT